VTESHLATQPHVYVILLNWNGWQDTIECLESVFRLNYPNFTVIVCDNASTDDSMERIGDWARGQITASCSSPDLSRLILPPIPKPIDLVSIHSSEVTTKKPLADVHLVLIQTGSNLGFAGGNNVGIRYALAHSDCDYIWLLNNDTVVEPDALSVMVRAAKADPKLGICGSLLRNYLPPHEIQTAGGRRYSRWTARSRPILEFDTPQISTRAGAPDYVEGASMLVSRKFLEEVGLLEESYFLYFEELDWAARGHTAFRVGYSPESVVYHKEGASIGSAFARAKRSALSDFYQARNRIVFTRRHCPWFLPSVLIAVGLSLLQRLLIGKPENAFAILRGALASFSRTSSGANRLNQAAS